LPSIEGNYTATGSV